MGFDFPITFLTGTFEDKGRFLSLSLFRRFEKGLLTLKMPLINS